MKSLNKVMLIGRLADDVDLRQTQNGSVLATFPVAINKFVMDDGVKKEAVDFYRVVVWGKPADLCNEYLEKGVPVFIEGKLSNYSYDDKNGVKHFRTEVVADDVNFLGFKRPRESASKIEVSKVELSKKEVAVN